MSAQTRVPPTEITGIYGGLVKAMTKKIFGKVPEGTAVLWNSPAVFKSLMGVSRKSLKWDHLDPSLATFASMATASLIGCSFCLDLNYFAARDKGLDEVKIREVPRWRESDVFNDVERSVMAYAEAMSQTQPAVTDEMVANLLTHLGAPALVELTALVGIMNMNARTNIALGIPSDEFAASCGMQPLAQRPTTVVSPT